jgi:eukaryotic-like serine/threonine-protein kinase
VPFHVPLDTAQADFPEYSFVRALTPSEQKAAFHVRTASGEDLCLKLIAPDYEIDRLNREILALQSIDHPNVVQLREYTFSSRPGQQRHFIIEEFVEGEDLSSRIATGQPWPLSEVAKFFSALFSGLQALHALRIVHRDLKPSNIRVRTDGSPVIIDFGLARHLGLPDLTKTSDGAEIGTPLYFAPEQWNGTKRDVDHRTDLFAAGILLHQALTGEHPFFQPGMSRVALKDATCTSTTFQTRPAYTQLRKEWALITSRLLEKERVRRPASASQVSGILSKLGVA